MASPRREAIAWESTSSNGQKGAVRSDKKRRTVARSRRHFAPEQEGSQRGREPKAFSYLSKRQTPRPILSSGRFVPPSLASKRCELALIAVLAVSGGDAINACIDRPLLGKSFSEAIEMLQVQAPAPATEWFVGS